MAQFRAPKSVELLVLSGQTLHLEPLGQSHYDGLAALVADKGELIFANTPMGSSFIEYFEAALAVCQSNVHVPYVLRENGTNAFIGMSRLFDIEPENSALEIGYTWYHPAFWGGPTNPDAKLTLMSHAFETLGFNRVQLKTDERNAHSRAAMTKLGATFEGVLRQHRTLPNGFLRSSAYFSVLASEWKQVKAGLETRLKA